MNWQIFSSLASGACVLYLGLIFALTAFLVGRPLFMRWTGSTGRGWEDGVFSAGLGAGAMALGIFFLGVIGLWMKPVLVLITLAVFGIGLRANRDLWKEGPLFKKTDPSSPRWTTTDLLLGGGLLVVFLFWIPFVLSPETFYDSLTNHLLLPWQWLQAGRLSHLPFNCTSGFPSNTEMLYLLSLAFSDERLAKTVHYLFAVGTALSLVIAGARYATRRAGLLGALLFVTLPLNGIEFSSTAVEFSGTFFTFLSVLSLLRSFDTTAPQSQMRRWLALAGVFSGFAMGTKYTLWLFPWAVAIPLAIRPGLLKEKTWGALKLWAVYFLTPSALLVVPWVVKNLIYFKNPIYPFLTHVFANSEAAFFNRGFFFSYAVNPLSLLSLRGVIFQYAIAPFLAESKLGWFWATCAVFVILIPTLFRSSTWRFVLTLFLIQWVAYGTIVHLVRYRLPALALLSLLIGVTVELGPMKRLRRLLLGGLVVVSAANFTYVSRVFIAGGAWRVSLGIMTKTDFLSGTRALYPAPPYPALTYLNRNTPLDAVVLVVGEARTFYLERRSLSPTIFDRHPVQPILQESGTEQEFYHRLRQTGVTHLLVNLAEASRLRGQWPPWTETEMNLFKDFMKKNCTLVFEDRHFQPKDFRHTLVYELSDRLPPATSDEEVGAVLMSFMSGESGKALPMLEPVPES